ncbi:hypothetical protein AVEN_223490-1, partial [Araneus ventricosus]
MVSRKRTLGELIFEDSDDGEDDYRHYSQRCLGIDIDDDTEDEEVLNNSLPLFYQVGTGYDNTPGPSSRGPPLIEGRDYS